MQPLHRRLESMAVVFARRHGLAGDRLVLRGPLHNDELLGMRRALEARILTVDDAGVFEIAGHAPDKGPYNLFSRGPNPSLNREYLIQISALAELVLDHGWPASRVSFEFDAFDLAAFNDDHEIVVVAEAKTTGALLDAMLAEIDRITPEQLANPSTNAQRKAAGLSKLRASVFWGVAPGVRLAFDLEHRHGTPRLATRDGVPTNAVISVVCPVCGSDDVRGGKPDNDRIPLHCDACAHEWSRTPRQPCPRCASRDVIETGYQDGWAFDDLVEAQDNTMAPWSYVERRIWRCRNCHRVWGTAPSVPDR